MTNAFSRFQALLPKTTKSVVSITSNNGNGTSNAITSAGVSIVVSGESVSPGNKAYVQNGEILRQAPNFSVTTVNV